MRKVVFICGEIKDLVSDSDKHCAYLDDPDDIDLNGEFDGLNGDEVDDLMREYVLRLFVLLTYDRAKVGNAVTRLSGNSAASSLTFRRKLTKGHLKSLASFMQR
jgi:hypothetical protein